MTVAMSPGGEPASLEQAPPVQPVSPGLAAAEPLPTRVADYAGALSIVVPVQNEDENVLPLITEICHALEGRAEFEVIYVDDGSVDATAARLVEAARHFPRLRVVRHRMRCGQSAAIRSGVLAARHAWIATLDGDGQNDPDDIAGLLAAVSAPQRAAGVALVVGWRVKRRDNALRRFSSRIANGVRSRVLGDATPDTGCGLKVFPRELFLQLPFFDHQHRFLPALFLREGARTVSVPVRHRPRRGGRSKYGLHNRLWVGIVDLFGVMWLMRRGVRAAIEP